MIQGAHSPEIPEKPEIPENLKKSGYFTSSQEKVTKKPENLKKSGFLS